MEGAGAVLGGGCDFLIGSFRFIYSFVGVDRGVSSGTGFDFFSSIRKRSGENTPATNLYSFETFLMRTYGIMAYLLCS